MNREAPNTHACATPGCSPDARAGPQSGRTPEGDGCHAGGELEHDLRVLAIVVRAPRHQQRLVALVAQHLQSAWQRACCMPAAHHGHALHVHHPPQHACGQVAWWLRNPQAMRRPRIRGAPRSRPGCPAAARPSRGSARCTCCRPGCRPARTACSACAPTQSPQRRHFHGALMPPELLPSTCPPYPRMPHCRRRQGGCNAGSPSGTD